jgi:hypothetical protein
MSAHSPHGAPEFEEPARLLREKLAAGRSIEEALTTLRAHTADFIRGIGEPMIALGLSLRDAENSSRPVPHEVGWRS